MGLYVGIPVDMGRAIPSLSSVDSVAGYPAESSAGFLAGGFAGLLHSVGCYQNSDNERVPHFGWTEIYHLYQIFGHYHFCSPGD